MSKRGETPLSLSSPSPNKYLFRLDTAPLFGEGVRGRGKISKKYYFIAIANCLFPLYNTHWWFSV
jgi:hypothetical protein